MKFLFYFITSSALFLEGCVTARDYHGSIPDDKAVSQIKKGLHTKEDVIRILGNPGTVGDPRLKKWYYIHRILENRSFFKPEVKENQVLIVSFDEKDCVKEIIKKQIDKKEIDKVSQVTATAVKDPGFFQQIFGSFGRFAQEDENEKEVKGRS
jgi:outer membrane protein assembly factor BamE (lipoprotein component of BamABCDE complex)